MKLLHTFLLLAAVFGFSACGEKPAEPVQALAPEPQSKGLIAATCLTLTNPLPS